MYNKKLRKRLKIVKGVAKTFAFAFVIFWIFFGKKGELMASLDELLKKNYESAAGESEVTFIDIAETNTTEEKGYVEKRGETHIMENVPHIYQIDDYPTGCESVSAVSLMQYYGVDISVDEFIDNYLPCTCTPYYYGGILVGEDPHEYFLGNPRSEYGFGCYVEVIKNAMEKILSDDFTVSIVNEKDLSALAKRYVSNNIPVMVWATMWMRDAEVGDSWELPDGDIFTFIRPEHALLLIGYDDEYYYFMDPMEKDKISAYEKEACERSYDALCNQALVILYN